VDILNKGGKILEDSIAEFLHVFESRIESFAQKHKKQKPKGKPDF
jgi:hypothetical protein